MQNLIPAELISDNNPLLRPWDDYPRNRISILANLLDPKLREIFKVQISEVRGAIADGHFGIVQFEILLGNLDGMYRLHFYNPEDDSHTCTPDLKPEKIGQAIVNVMVFLDKRRACAHQLYEIFRLDPSDPTF